MFSVNLTFDKTLGPNDAILLFCLPNRHFLGYKMCKYSKLNLNTFALWHSSTLVHTQLTVTVHERAAAERKSIQVEFCILTHL